jgi:hypothetical protein
VTPIRPFVEQDLPEVTALYERVIRSASGRPPPLLADYFRDTFLRHPWVDPEIPSLVYEEPGGRIIGFLGSHVRRLRFDGEPIRLACSGQLVTAPDARGAAPGAFLVREYMSGPQELTNTDGANEPMLRLWPRLGGEILHLSCIDWIRVFRPSAVAVEYALRGRQGLASRVAGPVTAAVDGLAVRLASDRFRPSAAGTTTEPLTPEKLVEHLDAIAASFRVYPDYDEAFARWLFRELAAVESRGRLFASLVRTSDGRAAGWYVGYARKGGVSDVVQVAALPRSEGLVIDQLLQEARSLGVSAVRGRLEPRLVYPLSERTPVLRYATGALVHSHDPELLRAIRVGDALLTRMEGEWWMGHHLERFELAAA